MKKTLGTWFYEWYESIWIIIPRIGTATMKPATHLGMCCTCLTNDLKNWTRPESIAALRPKFHRQMQQFVVSSLFEGSFAHTSDSASGGARNYRAYVRWSIKFHWFLKPVPQNNHPSSRSIILLVCQGVLISLTQNPEASNQFFPHWSIALFLQKSEESCQFRRLCNLYTSHFVDIRDNFVE